MADVFPLILGIIILLASVISIKTGISVTVVEIAIGVIIGNLGFFHSESWMIYIASFGGILLTFLAGIEIDVDLMKDNFKESFTIGFLSFLIPFVIVFLVTYYINKICFCLTFRIYILWKSWRRASHITCIYTRSNTFRSL